MPRRSWRTFLCVYTLVVCVAHTCVCAGERGADKPPVRGQAGVDILQYCNRMTQNAQRIFKEGDTAAAIEIYRQVLHLTRESVPKKSAELVPPLQNLAGAFLHTGRNEKALALYEEALDVLKANDAEYSTGVGAAYNNLGEVYFADEEYDNALMYFKKALKIRRKVLKEGDVDVIKTLHNVGATLKKLRERDEALTIFREAHLLVLEHLSEDTQEHKELILHSHTHMGETYRDMKVWPRAVKSFKDALRVSRNIFAEEKQREKNNTSTPTVKTNATVVDVSVKRADAEEELYAVDLHGDAQKDLLLATEKNNVENNNNNNSDENDFDIRLVKPLQDLASAYYQLDRHQEALALFEEELAILRHTHTPTNTDTPTHTDIVSNPDTHTHAHTHTHTHTDTHTLATCINNVAALHFLLGNFDQSQPLYKEAIILLDENKKFRPMDGDADVDFASAVHNLACVHRAMKNPEKSRNLFEKALKMRKSALGPDHEDTLETERYLAEFESA